MEDFTSFFYIKNSIHYSLHFLAPGLVAWFINKNEWKKIWLIFIATMLVDADHLFVQPIFDPERCSIGFHFLHSYYAIALYAITFLLVNNRLIRLVALGLLMHMATDYLDCKM